VSMKLDSACVGALLRHLGGYVAALPALHERRRSKPHRPTFDHLLLRPSTGALAINMPDEVIVITQVSVRADVDLKDRAERLKTLDHRLLAVRIVSAGVRVHAPQPRSTNAAGDAM